MTARVFEFLCPKCGARVSWSQGEGTHSSCPNCRHELEVLAHPGGKHGVRVVGGPAPRENPPTPEDDPLVAKVKRLAIWHRVFQVLSGLSLLVMVSYLLWNKFARGSAAGQAAYSEAARGEYTSLGWERMGVVIACVVLSVVFGLLAAQIKHYARVALEEAEDAN